MKIVMVKHYLNKLILMTNFKNYKSFRDEAMLDMTAVSNVKDFSERVVSVGNEKLLTLASIYGANASGKSNVYGAFRYMTIYVKYSFGFGGDDTFAESIFPVPFLFDSVSEKEDSEFEVYFIISDGSKEKCYNYGFCINHEEITEEWLNVKMNAEDSYKTVFYRSKADNKLDLSGLTEDRRENIRLSLEKETLIVSLGAKLKIGECKVVRDWFAENRFADFANTAENFYLSRRLPKNFGEDKAVQKKVIEYLATFDKHIKGFKTKRIQNLNNDIERSYKISSVHNKIDSMSVAEIPLWQESAGTLKMFALYPDLQEVLQKGRVVVFPITGVGSGSRTPLPFFHFFAVVYIQM